METKSYSDLRSKPKALLRKNFSHQKLERISGFIYLLCNSRMIELEDKMNIANSNWLMSCREKLAVIGLLHSLNPKTN